MDRRHFLAAGSLAAMPHAATADEPAVAPIHPLADDYVTVYESPDPARIFAYSPGLCRLPNGRLIATMDQGGPGVAELPNIKRDGLTWRGRIYAGDDHGRTWRQTGEMPMMHARPFAAGDSVYVLGHSGDLMIVRSTDGGDTWSAPAKLTDQQSWHQAPCSVDYANGKVYLVMERNTNTDPNFRGWAVSKLAPVVLAAKVDDDLTQRASWTFSSELSFDQAIAQAGPPHLLGVPFFKTGRTAPDNQGDRRDMFPIGWLETNVARIVDPDHDWYDPLGRTLHLFARAHTGSSNLACVAKAVEAEDGSITVMLEQAPSGEPMLYVPCPGGQMKFHIVYDAQDRLYWLLSSQATDSMTRPERLPRDRFNLPNNERHRLMLHFSKNCVDWCFAGLVAMGKTAGQARHYASLVIDGDDLHVLSRSGDERAKSAHDGNLITCHTVRGFRRLVY